MLNNGQIYFKNLAVHKILIHERVKKRTKQILTHLGEVELLCEMLRKSHHAKVTKKIPLSVTKWLNTLKQFVGNLSMNCLNVFDHFTGLVSKGLTMKNLDCA